MILFGSLCLSLSLSLSLYLSLSLSFSLSLFTTSYYIIYLYTYIYNIYIYTHVHQTYGTGAYHCWGWDLQEFEAQRDHWTSESCVSSLKSVGFRVSCGFHRRGHHNQLVLLRGRWNYPSFRRWPNGFSRQSYWRKTSPLAQRSTMQSFSRKNGWRTQDFLEAQCRNVVHRNTLW